MQDSMGTKKCVCTNALSAIRCVSANVARMGVRSASAVAQMPSDAEEAGNTTQRRLNSCVWMLDAFRVPGAIRADMLRAPQWRRPRVEARGRRPRRRHLAWRLACRRWLPHAGGLLVVEASVYGYVQLALANRHLNAQDAVRLLRRPRPKRPGKRAREAVLCVELALNRVPLRLGVGSTPMSNPIPLCSFMGTSAD